MRRCRRTVRVWALWGVALLVGAGASGLLQAQEAGWANLAPLPEPRTEVSVTSDGERVYVIGGFKAAAENAAPDQRPPAAQDMYVYDPGEDSWENRGPAPLRTHHAGFVYHEGHLYILGGYRDNSFEPIDVVWIYDIAADAWREGAPMPTARGALAYTVLDGRIHTLGGTVADKAALDHGAHNTDSPDDSVGTHEVYDPRSDSWERLAPLPTARNHHAAKAHEGRIYVTAGRAGDDYTMTVTEVYDASGDTWQEAAPLLTGRSGVAAAELDGWIYLFGGETFDPGAERTFDDAERYNPAEDRWEALAPMPTARHGLGAAVVDNAIYVVSGGPEPGFSLGGANERYLP